MSEEFDVGRELAAEAKVHALDLSGVNMPLDMTVRSVALTLATRHCGDRVVKEGNLYQQLKMDNKLAGPLTEQHVVYCALVFERYLWGEFSKGIAGDAVKSALDGVTEEIDAALKDKFGGDDDPSRSHSGGDVP